MGKSQIWLEKKDELHTLNIREQWLEQFLTSFHKL